MIIIPLVKRRSQNIIILVKYRFISSLFMKRSSRAQRALPNRTHKVTDKGSTARKSYKYKLRFMIKLKSYFINSYPQIKEPFYITASDGNKTIRTIS